MERIKFRMPLLNPDGSFKEWFYWGWGVGIADEFISPHSGYRNCPSQQFTGLRDKGGDGNDVFEGDTFEAIFKNCPDGYSIVGKETSVLSVVATVIFKWGKFMVELTHPETKKLVYKDLCDFLQNEQKVVVGNTVEEEIVAQS